MRFKLRRELFRASRISDVITAICGSRIFLSAQLNSESRAWLKRFQHMSKLSESIITSIRDVYHRPTEGRLLGLG